MKIPNYIHSNATKLSTLAGAFLACQCAHANLLFSEGFNYTAGDELGGQVNPGSGAAWSGGNTALSIGSSDLTYPGLQDLGGNDLVYTSGGSSSSTSYNTYSAVTSGSVYFSFLIDSTTLPTANNYLMALNPGTTTPGGGSDALSIYVGSSGTGYKIGVRTDGGGSGAAYATEVLALDTTYLIVGELTFNSGSETASLFFDPTPGGSQPATSDSTQTTTTAIASVDDIAFKAQTSSSAGDFDIDNLLIGTGWADVTPSVVPEPSTFGLMGTGLVAMIYRRRLIKL